MAQAGQRLSAPNFWYGAATAAYQIEGAWDKDGKGPSIWDEYCHRQPSPITGGDTGDLACDFYGRYKEDIALMVQLGVKAFRLSVSWPRLLPQGTGAVNAAGVQFYHNVLDELHAAGIEAWLTLYHWDLPLALHERYGGWLSEQSVQDFAEYAELCFREYGGKVAAWATFNEPWTFIEIGYHLGIHAPGHKHPTDHWAAGHHVLLAHAAAVQHFRRIVPEGRIGLNANTDWAEPLTDSLADRAAAERRMEFMCGRFTDPLYFGDYPASLRQRIPSLPRFTPEQSALLKGSADMFLINHYSSKYIADAPGSGSDMDLFKDDTRETFERNGILIGPKADSDWLYCVPWGMRKLLCWIDERYGGPEIVVTESGCDAPEEADKPLPEVLQDDFRLSYYQHYIAEAQTAVEQHGVKLRGYFAWSLLDNLEWCEGYNKRFGIVHVERSSMLQRTPKASAKWLGRHFQHAKQPHAAEQQQN